jgi:CRISPR-associated endonuclease/helicase Cas3
MPNNRSFFRYWGKADPNYSGEPKWHPLAYHCLDVAAVGRLCSKHRQIPALSS